MTVIAFDRYLHGLRTEDARKRAAEHEAFLRSWNEPAQDVYVVIRCAPPRRPWWSRIRPA